MDAPAKPQNILSLPSNVGKAIIRTGAVIACPILGTDKFVKYCKDRDLSINRERLLRLERLGLFAPVYRVRTPPRANRHFTIPPAKDNNWFTKGWAWDTTGVTKAHPIPDHKDRTQEGYYSIFQLHHLQIVLSSMTLQIHLDSYLESAASGVVDWKKNGERWLKSTRSHADDLCTHEFRRSLALLCQYISNRYYPQTQTDQRTIKISRQSHSDQWINVQALDWDWHEFVRRWNPHGTERLFKLTPEKLRHAYQALASAQKHCDPLERWYQLIQFVAVNERRKLKGDALRAEALRALAWFC